MKHIRMKSESKAVSVPKYCAMEVY